MQSVTVGQFGDEFRATLAKNLLEAEGIKSWLAGSIPQQPNVDGLPFGYVLQVADEDAERAKAVLADAAQREWSRYQSGSTHGQRLYRTYAIIFLSIFFLSNLLLCIIAAFFQKRH